MVPDAEARLLHALQAADPEELGELLNGDPALADVRVAYRWSACVSPLMLALGDAEGDCGEVRLSLLRRLLAAGADPDGVADPPNSESGTALHRAAWLNAADAIRLLLEAGANPELRAQSGERPIDNAARHGNLKAVAALVAGGAEHDVTHLVHVGLVDAASGHDLTEPGLLHLALGEEARDCPEMVRLLLSRGADPNARDARGRTALHLALESERTASVSILLEHGARHDLLTRLAESDEAAARAVRDFLQAANEAAPDGTTPLHYAVRFGRRAAVEALLAQGADPNAVAERWWMERTPLHSTAMRGHAEIARWLLQAGADLESRNEHDYTPLLLAVRWARWAVVDVLLSAGADREARDAQGLGARDWPRLFENDTMQIELQRRGWS